uniref:Uncharacterized protein n=1 Tax=Tetranychus urticae TaxID=32264 RepID=T1KRB7_TETUR
MLACQQLESTILTRILYGNNKPDNTKDFHLTLLSTLFESITH